MLLADELGKLDELHRRGALSDEEFARAKARALNGGDAPRAGRRPPAAINALRRSQDDAWLGGVCGGLEAFTGVAAWAWRLIFVALAVCGGTGVLVYLLLWIFVPREGAHPDLGRDGLRAG